MILLASFVVLFVVGFAVCFAIDTGCTFPIKRMIGGLMAAVTLAVALSIPVGITTCNDVEKYSFIWYLWGCFIYEQSS